MALSEDSCEVIVPKWFSTNGNPSARGAYMLRKSFVLVFIRPRVMARYHGKLL
jgi:hypothetical protein